MNLLDKFHFKDKNGIRITMEICDSFSRTKIGEIISNLSAKQNITDNALATSAKTIVGAINEHENDILEINSNLTPTYFQLTSGSATLINIEQQDCWCQGNRVHIAFSAIASIAMASENVWGIVPREYRGKGTIKCGFAHIDGNPDIYINSIMIDGVESGYIYQKWASEVPANTRVSFIADYFIGGVKNG